MRSTPVPKPFAGSPNSPNLLSSQGTQTAPRTGANLFGKELLSVLRKGCVAPTCLLGVCDLPSLGERDWRRRSGDSSCVWGLRSSELQREMSGDRRCLRSLDRPLSLPERCPSDRWPAGHPRQPHRPLCSGECSAGGVFWGVFGLTRVGVEAPGRQLQ